MKVKYIIVKDSHNPNDETKEELAQQVVDALLDGFVIMSSAGSANSSLVEIHYVLQKD